MKAGTKRKTPETPEVAVEMLDPSWNTDTFFPALQTAPGCLVDSGSTWVGPYPRLVYVFGFAAEGDGGEGLYAWDPDSVAPEDAVPGYAPNGILVVRLPNWTGPGRFRRIYDGPLNVKWFGARGDGITPDHLAINAAVAAAVAMHTDHSVSTAGFGATVYFPPGVYICNAPVVLGPGVTVRGAGVRATQVLSTLSDRANAWTWSSERQYGAGGGLRDINVRTHGGSAGHTVVFNNWDYAEIENVLIGADAGDANGYALAIMGCQHIAVRSADLVGGNPASLYVWFSTALRFDSVHMEIARGDFTAGGRAYKGAGAYIFGAYGIEFSRCVFQSNAGPGVVLDGTATFDQPYFEANGSDDMVLGTGAGGDISYATVVNPYFSPNRVAGKRAIYCMYLHGGAIIGGNYPHCTWNGSTAIELIAQTQGVSLIGINPGDGVIKYNSAAGQTIADYPGLIDYRDPTGTAIIGGSAHHRGASFGPSKGVLPGIGTLRSTNNGVIIATMTADNSSAAPMLYNDGANNVYLEAPRSSGANGMVHLGASGNRSLAVASDHLVIGAAGNTGVHQINGQAVATVGAAGNAAPPPAQPLGYLRVLVNGTLAAIPYYSA